MSYDFKSFTFGVGSHSSRDDGMCVMEAVAYIAGEPHSDHPKCACPIISAFMRVWNDGINDDDLRRELVGQFVFRLPGTKATQEIELRRSWMALDWLVRECAAEFLSLTPSLAKHAEVLRGLPEIGPDNVDMVVPLIQSAGDAARTGRLVDTAWDAGLVDAAREAAWYAAREAAWAAARAAAGDAAWAAAGDATGAAAGDAAWAAAGDATGAATGDALAPSVTRLQKSAVALCDRMIRLTEIEEVVSQENVATCH